MKIKNIIVKKSIILEFIISLFRINNNSRFDLKEELELDKGIEVNKVINSWADEQKEKFSKEMQGNLDKFFNYQTFFGLCLISEIVSLDIKTIENYIDYLQNKEASYFLSKFCQSGYAPSDKINDELIKNLLENEKRAVKFVNENLKFPSDQKWILIQFFFDPEKMKKDFINLLDWYYNNIFKHEEKWIDSKLNKLNDEFKTKIKRYGDDYLEDIIKMKQDKINKRGEIIVSISYLYENSMLTSFIKDYAFYLIGYRYPDLFVEQSENLLSSLDIFKSLADETRLNILRLLSQKTMYGNQLAEELDLTNATISHHVGKLVINNLISTEKDDQKMYFTADKENIKKIVNRALEAFLD